MKTASLSLVTRRVLRASAARLFADWTEAERLVQWWGPRGVTCTGAEIDFRVGGRYRIGNRFADGREVTITGVFERVEAPHCLVFSWRLEPGPGLDERVTVRFEPRGDATEIVIVHERIASEETRASHEAGWRGCLDGLARYASGG
jgi:uncharacterized protein YndB with AHSA1/START domain